MRRKKIAKILELSKYKNNNRYIGHHNEIEKNKLFLLIGIPGSGKSTYARRIKMSNPKTIIVSTDNIRKELTGSYHFSIESNKEVFNIVRKRILESVISNLDVIYDATNITSDSRENIISIAKDNNIFVVAVVFDVPLETCLLRNKNRVYKRVPEDVIRRMSEQLNIKVINSEGFDEIIYINE